MAETSSIEWTDATWNPIAGCSLKSPGCTHCYAMPTARRQELMMAALGRVSPYAGLTRVVNGKAVWTGDMRLVEAALTLPLRWQRPRRIFVNSMSDLFHEDVPDEWIDRVFAVMALCPQHTFQVLTKRADRMRAYLTRGPGGGKQDVRNHIAWNVVGDVLRLVAPAWTMEPVDGKWRSRAIGACGTWPLPNVWLGVSAEDQRRADERVPDLLATPAAVRFVSAEPLLGPIDFRHIAIPCDAPQTTFFVDALTGFHGARYSPHMIASSPNPLPKTSGLDWIIVGGESGPGARPMHPDWARQIRDACAAAGVAYLFKQWGSWGPGAAFDAAPSARSAYLGEIQTLVGPGTRTIKIAIPTRMDDVLGPPLTLKQLGKKAAGRLLDGVEHNGFPEVARG
ncbi:protein gp37 [Methylobacterium sp. PvP062]|uniref:Protein gp37 n=1 Tax=Methylobacterium radiotolerans TaxID=31998 RepID=A0ABV2NNH0_9HYPH|nr:MULTISPECIES: phage Gp37/Gp68 family protein [unclassified Methylobacterium]MBP2495236.1 protein gp37 [Methylobacterium sp. PvP105]MBP2504893.1 protein gp37 [Methylobacterium sp. PvP109]